MMADRRKELMKMVIIGDPNVGKTSLMTKFVHNVFSEDYKATIGADFLTRTMIVDDIEVVYQLWDTSGQERFASLARAFYRGTQACIIVYDATDKESFDHVDLWMNKFFDNIDDKNKAIINRKDFPTMLLANKCDLLSICMDDDQHRVIMHQCREKYSNNADKLLVNGYCRNMIPFDIVDVVDKYYGKSCVDDCGKIYANENNMLYFETSAMNGSNVKKAMAAIANETLNSPNNVDKSQKFQPGMANIMIDDDGNVGEQNGYIGKCGSFC